MHAILVDDYYLPGDGADDSLSFTRAYAAALPVRRHLRCTPGRVYNAVTSIEIWPDIDGWCPGLFGHEAVVTIASAAGGFRFRGLKSGANANPAEGFIKDLIIDADNVFGSSGMRGIAAENGGGLLFENVRGINYVGGYHILNFRYADGGAVVGEMTIRNCSARGHILTNRNDPKKWYGFSDTGDLSVAMPGDAVAAGATVVIATANTTSASYGTPSVATAYFWSNNTGAPIVIPASLLAVDMAALGLTQGLTTATLNGTPGTSAVQYEWYTSAGGKQADCVVQATGGLIDGFECDGGYYAAYLSGCEGYDVRRYTSKNAIRGFAVEWGAKNVKVSGIVVRESYSSAILYGYGCPGGGVDNFRIEEMTARWVGEALFNIQLGCPGFTIGAGTIDTHDNATGQHHIRCSVGSGDFEVKGPVRIKGDCAKAYICIESAWNSTITGTNPEHYPTIPFYNGAATGVMDGVRLRNIEIIADTVKGAHLGATAVCLMQVEDAINGQVGLTGVVLDNIVALSSKHARSFKIYEGAAAASQVNNVRMTNCLFETHSNPTTAISRMVIPRRWAHFVLVRNVSNLDDDVVRNVPDVALPDLTYGKYWIDLGVTAMSGFLGGQGAAGAAEGYDGREVFVRGNNSRALASTSGALGTKDGVRLKTTPVTLLGTQMIHLVYNRNIVSWIEV